MCLLCTACQETTKSEQWTALVSPNQDWKYLPVNKEVDLEGWSQLNYDDNHWKSGMGPIGFGDRDDSTGIKKCRALFLRKHFEIQDTSAIKGLLLFADYDDSFIAYINGREVARANIYEPGSDKDWDAKLPGMREARMYQGGAPESYELLPWEWKEALQTGQNVLAIQINNESKTSKDLTAWFALYQHGLADQAETLPDWFQAPIDFQSSNLPVLSLHTNQERIPNEPKILVRVEVFDTAERNSMDQAPSLSTHIRIEQRGSTSRTRFRKKSYGFKTCDAEGKKNKTSLLGLPADDDWILYGPYSDKTLIRNALVFHLAEKMGEYAPRYKYCELLIDGRYEGLYLLMEKINRSKGRLDLEALGKKDLAGDSLTGGYILKIDKRTGNKTDYWYSPYRAPMDTSKKIRLQVHYPKKDKLQEEQLAYIKSYMNAFEDALLGDNWLDPKEGYKAYVDPASFMHFFLINELAYNLDGYRVSTFLHKQRDSRGGKLRMGPVWDFNLSLGNGYNCEDVNEGHWLIDYNSLCTDRRYHVPFWWKRMLSDPDFASELQERYKRYRKDFLSDTYLNNWITAQTEILSEAVERNYRRWPTLGVKVWPNLHEGKDYADEIEFMRSWLMRRMVFMDQLEQMVPDAVAPIVGED